MDLQNLGRHAFLRFKQSMSHFPYFMFVWSFLAPLCQGMFRIYTHTVRGTVCYAAIFQTRSLLFLTELHTLFYVTPLRGQANSNLQASYCLPPAGGGAIG
jgi:hypothetical protein